jgi:CHASE3 domain sensor protein
MVKKGFAIFGAVLVLFGIMMFFSYTSANDTEITKRSLVTSQQDVCKANFDKMFKVISQSAQVPQEFMEKAKRSL